MAFLLDTNVVSASRRAERQAVEFQEFLRAFDVEAAYLSTIAIMETNSASSANVCAIPILPMTFSYG